MYFHKHQQSIRYSYENTLLVPFRFRYLLQRPIHTRIRNHHQDQLAQSIQYIYIYIGQLCTIPSLREVHSKKPQWEDTNKLRTVIVWTKLVSPKNYIIRFAFIGEPTMSVDLDPVVGKSQYNLTSLPSVSDIIREFLAFKIRRMTFPNKEKLRVPMAAS